MKQNTTQTGNTENDIKWRSGRFSIAAERHALMAMEETAGKFWWVAAVPVMVLIAAGLFHDWRYGIVAAMIVFIIMPLIVLTGWLKAMTSPGALRCVYDMEATVSNAGDMTLRFFHKKPPRQDDDRRTTANDPATTDINPVEEPPAEADDIILLHKDLRGIRCWRGCIVMDYQGFRLIIPSDDTRRESIRTLLELTGMWDSHNYL